MRSIGFLAFFLPIWCTSGLASEANAVRDTVLIEVDGVKLTVADLEQKQAPALFQARTAYYEAERKVIQEFIDGYLLERQAQKEGVTVAQLLDKHVNSVVPKDPSEEALHVYYEGVDTTEPYEAVRGKIVDALRQRRLAKAKAAYLQELRGQVPIIMRLPPPRAPISMRDVPLRGAADARVTVLEFADYECPYCQQIRPVLDRIEADFKGKIAFGFKDFPLTMHASAPKAAEAAHCAGSQGKYWEYHDLLFAKKGLDPAALKAYARDLKLNTQAFDACLDTGQMATVVTSQSAEALALGLQGTPTILVNGRSVTGGLTYEKIRAVVAEELSAASGQVGSAADSPSNSGHGSARNH